MSELFVLFFVFAFVCLLAPRLILHGFGCGVCVWLCFVLFCVCLFCLFSSVGVCTFFFTIIFLRVASCECVCVLTVRTCCLLACVFRCVSV